MRITWRDGVTTIATAGTVALQQAYVNHSSWPLVSNMHWAIAGIAVLGMVAFIFSFVLDSAENTDWLTLTILATIALGGIAVLAILLPASSYVTIGMLATATIWLASIGWHLLEPDVWQAATHA